MLLHLLLLAHMLRHCFMLLHPLLLARRLRHCFMSLVMRCST